MAASWPAGSLLAFALRMRAWICRQSAMARHCSSRRALRPALELTKCHDKSAPALALESPPAAQSVCDRRRTDALGDQPGAGAWVRLVRRGSGRGLRRVAIPSGMARTRLRRRDGLSRRRAPAFARTRARGRAQLDRLRSEERRV